MASVRFTITAYRSKGPVTACHSLPTCFQTMRVEPGVNSGPGVDSLARYIYLHGTNHEDRLGEPVSHGCIRLGNADVVDVCDRVREGDPVVIV